MKLTTNEIILTYLAERVSVTIYKNNETGSWLWAVQVNETDFWLASFEKCQDAMKYCLLHQLPYTISPVKG